MASWVLSDDIYEALAYDGVEVVPMYRAVPEIADQLIVLNGVAKSYAMTGWRVGWMVGPADVIKSQAPCSPTSPQTSTTSPKRPRWKR